MPFKDKIASFLFGSRSKREPDEALQPELDHIPQEAPETPAAAPDDPTLLELSADHPIRQLRDLWQEESGQHLPALRLCMDEDGTLPPELLDKEKSRLQSSLKSVCGSRWKAAKGRARGKHGKKHPEEEADPVVLDARPWFFLSSDKLFAWMLVFPPVGPGEELSRDMLYRSLESQGVSFGLDTALPQSKALTVFRPLFP